MNGTLVTLRTGSAAFKAPSPRREDSWGDAAVATRRRFTLATVLVLVVSVVLHGALVATTLLERSPSPKPEQEIAVEVVQDVPKPPEPAKKAEARKAAAPGTPTEALAKPPEALPKPPDPPAKQVAPPPEAVKAPPPPPPAPPPKPAVVPPQAPPDLKPSLPPEAKPAPQHSDAELKALQDELAKLQAEHDTLAAEQAKAAAAPPKPASLPAGFGPLPDSFQAVALPSDSAEDGEAVGYAAIVFSQLAKAKEIGGKMGLPGTAGVHFVIDEKGALIIAELVHSSGIKALDTEALEIVHRAAPFPAPPQGAQRDFSANVSFVAGTGR